MSESIFGRTARHINLSATTQPSDVAQLIISEPHELQSSPKRSRSSKASSRYASAASSPRLDTSNLPTEPHEKGFPEVLIISGLESAPSPAQIKLSTLLQTSKIEVEGETYTAPEGFMTFWVRDGNGPEVPSWVVGSFIFGCTQLTLGEH